MNSDPQIDFAISYAGEDVKIAKEIAQRLEEFGFLVFLADKERDLLVGLDGEKFFEKLFTEAKEIIVFISKHYKNKDWTRYEWDIIRERDLERRFIPIRLDDTKILGLPSNFIYISFTETNYDKIVATCIKKLLLFERDEGIHRATEYEGILNAIKNESKGTLAEAYQLVKDKRKRTPLNDCELPEGNFEISYEIVKEEWCNFSIVKRRAVKILVPSDLTPEELRFNLKHCAATQFNAFKPDAIMVFAYVKVLSYDIEGIYTAGRAIFAPFGKWEKAKDGVAYNIPTEEFEFSIDFAKSYFSSKSK